MSSLRIDLIEQIDKAVGRGHRTMTSRTARAIDDRLVIAEIETLEKLARSSLPTFDVIDSIYELPVRRRPLSESEIAVIRLVAEAKSDKEIAAETGLTPGTVKEYLHHVYGKTGKRNRTELALWWLKNNPS